MKYTKEQKLELDQYISYGVKEGYLDIEDAEAMSYEAKHSYRERGDVYANSLRKGE